MSNNIDSSLSSDHVANSNSTSSIAENLMDRMIAAALPTTINPNELDQKIRRQRERPPFSIQLTSRNFQKMTSRLGIVYELYYLFNEFIYWKKPSLTLTILSLYSFICLNPKILLTLPSAATLLFIMVPAFAARHPPAPSPLANNPVIASGPPLREPPLPRPVPNFSREFYLNMVDTQNSMLDFVIAYDAAAKVISSLGLFANEARSCLVFCILTTVTAIIYILEPYLTQYVPWRIIFMLTGWITLASTFPFSNGAVEDIQKVNSKVRGVSQNLVKCFDEYSAQEFSEIDALDQRQVEAFELQWIDSKNSQWSSSIYINEPSKSQSHPPTAACATALSEILPPKEWMYSSKSWKLDYSPEIWVSSRNLSHLFFIDSDEKWVYDTDRSCRRRRWLNTCTRKYN